MEGLGEGHLLCRIAAERAAPSVSYSACGSAANIVIEWEPSVMSKVTEAPLEGEFVRDLG
ncbi:hypothetical protein PISMIDRAFT_682665 [Pisolithus microcarpus 441]|uniref:Unplaced genomic scaffold scaffold_89, whole genome shotgun sequence n=1 Tax=Pisolithus microcarpus 441 TaxID=765257 RepID=A0A0C9ZC84_9AGAM|nr:hypothetical protein PISMIDRAFT_682665 [Pisolithus microcarpus 441]